MEFIELGDPTRPAWLRLSSVEAVSVSTPQRGSLERTLTIAMASGQKVEMKCPSMTEATEAARRIIKHATNQATRPVRTEEIL
jgi:hypothetical protein